MQIDFAFSPLCRRTPDYELCALVHKVSSPFDSLLRIPEIIIVSRSSLPSRLSVEFYLISALRLSGACLFSAVLAL